MTKPVRAIVIHSPHSGGFQKLGQACQSLQEAGVEIVQNISVAELDPLPPQGKNWIEKGIDVAIAAGGDGLVGGVITHIAESGLLLGILPLGTSNDIARSLRIPQDLEQAAGVIAQGKMQEVDIGVARPAEQAPHAASREQRGPVLAHVSPQKHGFFAHALTVGLNVEFARIATNVATRQRFGHLTYPFAALEILRSRDAHDVALRFEGLAMPQSRVNTTGAAQEQTRTVTEATTDDRLVLRCRALQVAVINAPIFGGQWELSIPNASLDDRLLDIVVIEEIEFGRLSTRLAHLFNQKEHPEMPISVRQEEHAIRHPADFSGIPGLHHFQAKGVIIATNVDPRDVTLDGEVRGQTPIYVHMAPERLRVLVPA